MVFVDTNYFLRFLLADINSQHRQAKQLFKQGAEGKIKLFTSLVVFFEIYWVLESFYQKQRDELVEVLGKILALDFIELKERRVLLVALRVFGNSNFDLEDAFNLAYAKSAEAADFKTFDTKLYKHWRQKAWNNLTAFLAA